MLCECIYVLVYAHECKYPWRAEEGIRSLGYPVIDGCELPNTDLLEE